MSEDTGPTDEERVRPDEISGGELPPGEIDRMFDLLEEAIEAEALSADQFDRLVDILRRAVGGETASNPETLAELLSALEQFVLDPEGRREMDVDGVLDLFEEAVSGAGVTDPAAFEELFDVIETGIQDPTAVDPADVDRFQSAVRRALAGVANPTQGLDTLLSSGTREQRDGQFDAVRLARLAAAMTQRATGNSVESGVRAGTRLTYAAANAESPAALLTATRAITLDELQRAGIDIGEQQAEWLDIHEEQTVDSRPLTRESLAQRGAQLLSQSTEVGRDESLHPAFVAMLDQLSTDEARILRLLATEGPQGVIDVYDRQYLPPKRWRVARNLTMLGRDAGCRIQRRAPVYVQNLQRLGIVEVSEDPIENLKRYEILEAQSHIERARDRARRPRTDYKRVQLTDMGIEFCELCFPFEVTVDGEGLPLREDGGDD
jgi:hypothetical protein